MLFLGTRWSTHSSFFFVGIVAILVCIHQTMTASHECCLSVSCVFPFHLQVDFEKTKTRCLQNKKILQNTWNSNCLLLSPLPPYHLQNIPPPEQGPENWFALSRGRPGLHRLAASSTAGNPAVTARLEMEPSGEVENINHTNQKNPLEDSGQLPYVYIYKLYTWYLRVGPKICTRRCVAALLAFSLGDGGPSWWSGSPPKWVERFWWDFFTSKIPRNITEVLRLPSIFTWSFSTCVVYFDYRIIIIGSWDG